MCFRAIASAKIKTDKLDAIKLANLLGFSDLKTENRELANIVCRQMNNHTRQA
jgi:hypothetical protein